MLYSAILATILFLASAGWMLRDAYRAVRALDRPPAVLSIVVFAVMGEITGILWLLVYGVK